jgi:hypothetical protein
MDMNMLAQAYAQKMAEKGFKWVLGMIHSEFKEACHYAEKGNTEDMIKHLRDIHKSVGCIIEAYDEQAEEEIAD